jgi:hypothetical protein
VDAFFPKIAEFQKPPRHLKWREVNISATLAGWKRFEAAQEWLDNQRLEAQRNNPNSVPAPVEQAASGGVRSASSGEQPKQTADPALFEEFHGGSSGDSDGPFFRLAHIISHSVNKARY